MILHPDLHLASAERLAEVIATETDATKHVWADAEQITTALFGDAVTANGFVVGMAVRGRRHPVSTESLEQAIELNGVAVEKNLAAFRWGRAHAARPGVDGAPSLDRRRGRPALPASLARRVETLDATTGLGDLLARLTDDLIGFQDVETASAISTWSSRWRTAMAVLGRPMS
ncbi:MAG: hypothetical protein R2710_18105 [Acidimicrobiales bacterium]